MLVTGGRKMVVGVVDNAVFILNAFLQKKTKF